jgi:hypothetical protein
VFCPRRAGRGNIFRPHQVSGDLHESPRALRPRDYRGRMARLPCPACGGCSWVGSSTVGISVG